LANTARPKETEMNVEVTRVPPAGTKVLWADRSGVLHARSYCDTVSEALIPRIGPRDDEPRCLACCHNLIED
jgi:hypothetical protein